MALQDVKENLSVCCCFHIFPVLVFFFAFHSSQSNMAKFKVSAANVIEISPH